MGLVRFMSEADAGNLADEDWSFQILASADEVSPLVAKSEVDIAAVPANLASVLYNKTVGGVRVVAVNTLGVLYVCELGDEVNTVSDLRGRTIYSAGKGATPQYALEYVLRQAGLDPDSDVTIEWKSEHAECVAALAEGAGAVAMLPQPFVTTAQAKNGQIRVALDLEPGVGVRLRGRRPEGPPHHRRGRGALRVRRRSPRGRGRLPRPLPRVR